MHAGKLPADPKTLAYETNAVALEAHAYGDPHIPVYQVNPSSPLSLAHIDPLLPSGRSSDFFLASL